MLHPCTLRDLWTSFWSKDSSRYYTLGRGKKKALLEIAGNDLRVRPYSPRPFETWTKRLYEVCLVMSSEKGANINDVSQDSKQLRDVPSSNVADPATSRR